MIMGSSNPLGQKSGCLWQMILEATHRGYYCAMEVFFLLFFFFFFFFFFLKQCLFLYLQAQSFVNKVNIVFRCITLNNYEDLGNSK